MRNSSLVANVHQKRFDSNEIVRDYEEFGRNLDPPSNMEFEHINFKGKILNTCWHPQVDCIAAANQNCIFLFAK